MRPAGVQGFDRLVDRWVSEVSLGIVDDEHGSVETGKGWFGMIRGTLLDQVEKVARSYGEELTADEAALLRKAEAGVVVNEMAGGEVTVRYFDDAKQLAQDWAAVKEEFDMTYGTAIETRRRVK